MTDRTDKRVSRALAIGVALLTAANLLYYLPRVVDDLFISLRYAENLVHGRGLVYNVGERVEGFSSASWMMLQALGLALHVEGVLWTKLLGVASLVALHVGLYRFTREVFCIEGPIAALPNLCLALDSYVVAWSTLGLETPAHLAFIVWCFVLARRASRGDAPRAGAIAIFVATAATRPEGLGWALLPYGVELFVGPLSREQLRARTRRLGRIVLPAAACVGLLLCARRLYYDDWVPHTYYAKAESVHRSLENLQPLWTGPLFETIAVLSGVGLLVVAARDREKLPGVAVVAFTAAFVVAVEVDWMPSLRHFLPLLVVAPVGLAWAADRLRARRRVVAIGLVALACVGAISTARIDLRSVRDPFPGDVFVTHKNQEKLHDVLLSLRGVEPPHVATMDRFWMGMIAQNYRVLESSAAPVDDSWYVGRDIGKVGYYTDVKVFETAGLFTPAVVEDPTWRANRTPSHALFAEALSKKPIAIEWFEWAGVAGHERDLLRDFRIVAGDLDAPIDLDRIVAGPTPAEILRRYERSLAKFPRAFLLATLHGESVGGAMARRTRIVRDVVREMAAMGGPPDVASPKDGFLDAGLLAARGCTITPPKVRPGEEAVLRCWFDVQRSTPFGWTFFVHFVDEKNRLVFGADHPPAAGLLPSWKWRAGTPLRDVHRFVVPPTVPRGTYGMRIGMFRGAIRARAVGVASEAGDRLVGPPLEIVW